MTIYAIQAVLPGGCGVGVYEEFVTQRTCSWDYTTYHDISLAPHRGGAGYLVVHYVVGQAVCDEAYAILKDRFPIVFESEKRLNLNSYNTVYFCVYDTADKCDYGRDAVNDYELELEEENDE